MTNEAQRSEASDSTDKLGGWIDPRPHYPPFGCFVEVKCSDGSVRRALCENTWDGVRWKTGTGMCDYWSMAHPQIIGWRQPPNTRNQRPA